MKPIATLKIENGLGYRAYSTEEVPRVYIVVRIVFKWQVYIIHTSFIQVRWCSSPSLAVATVVQPIHIPT